MEWKDIPSNPVVVWVGLILSIVGLPALLLDDVPMLARLAMMNPTVSAYFVGVGSAILFLFLIAKISQSREEAKSKGWSWKSNLHPIHVWPGIALATTLIALTAYFGFPPDKPKESPPAPQEEVVQRLRTLQGYVLNGDINNPAFPEQWHDARVIIQRLSALRLAPIKGFTVSIDARGNPHKRYIPETWRAYLAYILPIVETYGLERALEATRHYNEVRTGKMSWTQASLLQKGIIMRMTAERERRWTDVELKQGLGRLAEHVSLDELRESVAELEHQGLVAVDWRYASKEFTNLHLTEKGADFMPR